MCTEHFSCCIFGTTTAVTIAGVVVVALTLAHRYIMQSVVTGQAPITCILTLFNMRRLLWGSWMKYTLAVRRSDMLPVRMFGFWRGECLTMYHRPSGVSRFWYGDGEYMKNSVPYILQGRLIDVNEHMYVDNLAVDEKQYPPSTHCFGGCTIRP